MERPSTAPPTTPLSSAALALQGLERTNWPMNYEDLFQANTDWSLVNQTLTVLTEQAEKCERDLQTLLHLREEALQDPEGFLQKMQKEIKFPTAQNVQKVPWVNPLNWASGMRTRRGVNGSRHAQNQEILVRRLDELQSKESFLYYGPSGPLISPSVTPLSSSNNSASLGQKRSGLEKAPSMSALDKSANKKKRITAPSRSANSTPVPASHNVAWTEEEKAKLNFLLAQYPEESVPSRRWAKISAAMGTRTATQVATRVAKQKAKRERILLANPTAAPILPEGELDKSKPEYEEYKRLQAALEKYAKGEPVQAHLGFECDGCKAQPILGTRHECSCRKYDLCDVCFQAAKYRSTPHRNHTFTPANLQ